MNTKNFSPNNNNNLISSLFGLARHGTSWVIDVIVTIVVVFSMLWGLDFVMPNSIQVSAPLLSNTFILVPTGMFTVWFWRRVTADNKRRLSK